VYEQDAAAQANENLSERGMCRVEGVFTADDPTGSLQAVCDHHSEARWCF
jgi:hypothetical protein